MCESTGLTSSCSRKRITHPEADPLLRQAAENVGKLKAHFTQDAKVPDTKDAPPFLLHGYWPWLCLLPDILHSA